MQAGEASHRLYTSDDGVHLLEAVEMSLYYDIMICCDLREDTPQDVIDAIRYLAEPDFQLAEKKPILFSWVDRSSAEFNEFDLWSSWADDKFLVHNPANEVISSFQPKHRLTIPPENNREVYQWSLQYIGRKLHEDGANHREFALPFWLAQYAEDGFVGCIREQFGLVQIVYSHERKYILKSFTALGEPVLSSGE